MLYPFCQVEKAEAVSSCVRVPYGEENDNRRLKGPIGPLKSSFIFQAFKSWSEIGQKIILLCGIVFSGEWDQDRRLACLISPQLAWFYRMSRQECAASVICFKTSNLYCHHHRYYYRSMLRSSFDPYHFPWPSEFDYAKHIFSSLLSSQLSKKSSIFP